MAEYLSAEEIAAILRREGDKTVSARTVHYYAELKLLPPPEYEGNRPRYTEAHLEAMREARRQKRQGKRLRELSETAETANAAILRQTPILPLVGSVAPSAPAIARSRGPVTIRVAKGLTLQAEGWSDADLTRIVQAIQAALEQSEGGSSS
jgi:DNA-binding transcriptional MerR regulator